MTVNLSGLATGLAILLATATLQTGHAFATEGVHAVRVMADPACVSRIVQLPLRWQNAAAPRVDWCRASTYGATPSEQAARRAVMQACC